MQTGAATRVPILVASSSEDHHAEALAAGAERFLPKADVDAHSFAEAVIRLLIG